MAWEGAQERIPSRRLRGREGQFGAALGVHQWRGLEHLGRHRQVALGHALRIGRQSVGEGSDFVGGSCVHKHQVVGHDVGVLKDQPHGRTGRHPQFAGHESQTGRRLNPQRGAHSVLGRFPSLSQLSQGLGVGSQLGSGQGASERIVEEDGGRTASEIAEQYLDAVQARLEFEVDLLFAAPLRVVREQLHAVDGDVEEAVFHREGGRLGDFAAE